MSVKRVAVVGAGIIGVSSALRILQEVPGVEVTLLSHKFSPETTGDGSAGFIMPFALGPDTDPRLVRKWTQETFDYLKEKAISEDNPIVGITLMEAYWISQTSETLETLTEHDDFLLHKTPMTEKQLSIFPPEYKYGTFGLTVVAECKRLIPYFTKKIKALGGKIKEFCVDRLTELSDEYDVVINCTGLGARRLADDPEIYPLRGQIIKVKAPWIKHAVITPTMHVLPGSEITTLGGTKQMDNWSLEVDSKDKERIWNNCCSVIPSLKHAEVVQDWVGLRPFRKSVRLEKQVLQDGEKSVKVIHNYGHGGSGVTLFWGCAGDVVRIIQQL